MEARSTLSFHIPTFYSPAMSTLIFKICPVAMWEEARREGIFRGAPVDLADGFIHFSTAGQVKETAAKHFSGQHDLVLVAVNDASLGEALKYEVSRGGALFPHLYASLDPALAVWVKPLPLLSDGNHEFPDLTQ